jgi:predicted Zn-dependent protease
VRSVGRAIVLGLGVRVVRGVASGYAYTEELSEARMLEAARTAGQIASHGQVACAGGTGGEVAAQFLSRAGAFAFALR